MALLDPDDGTLTGITVSGEEGKCTDITGGTGTIDIGFQTITLPCVDNDDDGYLEWVYVCPRMYLFSTDHHWNNNINCVAYLSFLLKLKYCRDPSFHIVLVHSGNVECEPPYSYPGKPTYYMLRVKFTCASSRALIFLWSRGVRESRSRDSRLIMGLANKLWGHISLWPRSRWAKLDTLSASTFSRGLKTVSSAKGQALFHKIAYV